MALRPVSGPTPKTSVAPLYQGAEAKSEEPAKREVQVKNLKSVQYPITNPYTLHYFRTDVAEQVVMDNWTEVQLQAGVLVEVK